MAIRRGFWPGRAATTLAARYARVSTHDRQTLGPPIEAMTAYIKGCGFDLVRQVKHVGSGAEQRPGREGLLKAARRRDVDAVVVWRWRLDRWGRSLLGKSGTDVAVPFPSFPVTGRPGGP